VEIKCTINAIAFRPKTKKPSPIVEKAEKLNRDRKKKRSN